MLTHVLHHVPSARPAVVQQGLGLTLLAVVSSALGGQQAASKRSLAVQALGAAMGVSPPEPAPHPKSPAMWGGWLPRPDCGALTVAGLWVPGEDGDDDVPTFGTSDAEQAVLRYVGLVVYPLFEGSAGRRGVLADAWRRPHILLGLLDGDVRSSEFTWTEAERAELTEYVSGEWAAIDEGIAASGGGPLAYRVDALYARLQRLQGAGRR